jgi:hypothetical protein
MTPAHPALSTLPSSLLAQPQAVFFLLVGAVWLFKAISRAKAAFVKDEPGPQEAGPPGTSERAGPVETSLSDEERALLVRRDILQKRAQRSAEAAALMGVPKERRASVPPPLARVPAAGKSPAAQPLAGAPSRATPTSMPAVTPAGDAPAPSPGALWLDELRTRDSARRAILLREILGQPVALR